MSKFQPKRLNDEINMSTENPVGMLFKFLGGFILLLGAFYLILGYSFELILSKVSVEKEQKIWSALDFASRVKKTPEELEPQLQYAQKLFDQIPPRFKNENYNYEIFITEDTGPNAFALPGGKILITSGLFDFLETENGLMFVLGHELGHIQNRDHLKGLGFNVAGLFVSILLSGQNSTVTEFFANITSLGDLASSRGKEEDADEMGLDVLYAIYGHAGGAEEFFEKLDQTIEGKISGKIPTILSTHPSNKKRIDTLLSEIDSNNMTAQPTTPIKKFK